MKKNEFVFTTLVPKQPLHSHNMSCMDSEVQKLSILTRVFYESSVVTEVIEEIEKNHNTTSEPIHFSIDVYKLIVEGAITKFGIMCTDEDKLNILPTKIVLSFLRAYLDYLNDYENCKIQGLIPMNRIDTWSCVPNEYVKEEYWKKSDSET